jgi:hypothetical protein
MKKLSLPLAVLAFLFTISCKPAPKEEAMEPIPAADFNVVLVQHPVKDYDMWKPLYLGHDSVRMAYGLHHTSLGRGVEDPNTVFLALRSDDVARAKEFVAMPELKTVMDSAGVTGPPTVHYVHVIRFDSTTVAMKDRLTVIAKVKDFDTFLKVFDGEGRKTRMEHGLVDRGLGRGVDDPNMVYIAFAVSDVEKAKARLASEELKTLMADSGVEGPPTFHWYTVE